MAASDENRRLTQLDGWRAVSICLVLAAHLLPLGPLLGPAAGSMGMALFFTLSGYLITRFLIHRPEPKAFLIRRAMRILPLAWGVLLFQLPFSGQSLQQLALSASFLQNYFFSAITPYNSHYWSLCVEIHFYLGAALLVAVGGRRGLWAFPVLLFCITTYRFTTWTGPAIETHKRVDEILSGACLALASAGWGPRWLLVPLRRISPWVGLSLLFAASVAQTGAMSFLRPYAGAFVVGATLQQPSHWLSQRLGAASMRYIATVSYAVYVIHGPLRTGWFSEGDVVVRYLLKRPLTLLLTFAMAHLSTFYWEARWIALAKRWTRVSRDVKLGPLGAA